MNQRRMECLKCGGPVVFSDTACKACGTLLDADGDGVPDVLDKLIEEKARTLIAEAKALEIEQAEAARIARAQAEETESRARLLAEQEARVEQAKGTLEKAHRDLKDNVQKKRPFATINRWTFLLVILIAATLALISSCVETACHVSVGGPLFCDRVCAGCRGPGRVFTWHTSGSDGDSDSSIIVCHNSAIDVDALGWSDAVSRHDGDLAAYTLTTWSSFPAYWLFFLGIGLFVGPFLFARAARRSLEEERQRLLYVVAENERLTAPGPEPPRAGYR